ncbi:MAG: acetyl-CoA carboxylase carboxyltransferase subunit alpha [Lachnospiraceae bacterium]|nr:acetyl-CoA carboxylase carboxyltransferase subunit alpha [Lachnospiraceae bacterium]
MSTVVLDLNNNPKNFTDKRETLLGYRRMRLKRTAHHSIGSHLLAIFDNGRFTEEFAMDLQSKDPLHFPGYEEKLSENRKTADRPSACVAGIGTIHGIPAVGAELSRFFLMGSMGSVEGEKLTLAIEEADRRKLPLIIFSASGGARMQEGMFSLMQMAKTSAAVQKLRDHGGLYISVLTHPTTGGVSASFASLGDLILAEPGALIGFAGPRVIEQTIGEKLPKGFQRAEFQLEHGFVDRIVPRKDEREVITQILKMHGYASREMQINSKEKQTNSKETSSKEKQTNSKKMQTGSANSSFLSIHPAGTCPTLSVYDRIAIVRDKSRPKITDYIDGIFDDFMELSGDRLGKEDPAILGGIALLAGRAVTVIGHRKGKDLKDNLTCNFGMPEPEGYRKALRLMKEAERFGRPVVTFIDTPGAYPGKEAEEHGQSVAIAENLAAMSSLRVPVISIVTGEGNSGGALAIGVGDEIWMLENAVYSVLSPEGFASILWKDASKAAEASEVMKMTAEDLLKQGIADRILPEPAGGAQKDLPQMCRTLKTALIDKLEELTSMSMHDLLEKRYQKYRDIGRINQ